MDTEGDLIRNFELLRSYLTHDEGKPTATSEEQIYSEGRVMRFFNRYEQMRFLEGHQLPRFQRTLHIRYLENSLRKLSKTYECLDCSRPWMVYWILNSATLLNYRFSDELMDRVVSFLGKCRSATGGFGGGPGQMAHLAPTYAAVNALVIIGTESAYETIDKKSLVQFLWSVRQDATGAFSMHVDGELDVRGAYCAVAVAKLCDVSMEDEKRLFERTVNWICECQTYEGGIGGVPNLEAHGGYSFCAIAALALLGSIGSFDLHGLLRWATQKQMRYEGGFSGRTNKLVDGCYSFWVGGTVVVAQALISKQDPLMKNVLKRPVFDRSALQEYILFACQYEKGGLLDKPDKPPDLYHTCYALSGVSLAQHSEIDGKPLVVGDPNENELVPTHPLQNVPPRAAWKAYVYFHSRPDDAHDKNHNNYDHGGVVDEDVDNDDDMGHENGFAAQVKCTNNGGTRETSAESDE